MKVVNGKIAEATRNEMFDYYLTRDWDTVMPFAEYLRKCEENGTKITGKEKGGSVMSAVKMRRALPNPPPKKLNRVTRRLEDATRKFLNYLAYCKSARSGNFFECKDWMHEMSDELCALCAHYNTINDNRKHKGKGGAK